MGTAYDDDAAAWALEQAELLRSGEWALLDIEHITEEIEDINICYQYRLAHRMALLMANLLKWKYQPDRSSSTSWEATITTQREKITQMLEKMPSLRDLLIDPEWDRDMWEDAQDYAAHAVNYHAVPPTRCWDFDLALTRDFFPEPENGGRQ